MTVARAPLPEGGADRPRGERWLRLGLLVAVVLALNGAGGWVAQQIDLQVFPRHEPLLHAMVLGAAALYVVLMVVPFMPGIEVGLALMLALGNRGALLVYLCTVLALAVGFAIGRLLPTRSSTRLTPFLLRHRYLAIALLLNLPGNALIGGGGGIALVSGMSGVFSFAGFVALTAVAVAPVPLLFFLGY